MSISSRIDDYYGVLLIVYVPQFDKELKQLCDAVTGPTVGSGLFRSRQSSKRTLHLASEHGLSSILYQRLSPDERTGPAGLGSLREKAVDEAKVSLLQENDVRSVSRCLKGGNIRSILIKGTALAYLYYPSPNLRPRADADLFVAESSIERAHMLLTRNGYRCEPLITPLARGRYLTTQFVCRNPALPGRTEFDIHWRINNSTALGSLLTFEELFDSASPVPSLGEGLKTPKLTYSLLISCIHWAGEPKKKLIWLYDLHLLNRHMDQDAWQQVIQLALEKSCVSIVLAALEQTAFWFDTRFPSDVLEKLKSSRAQRPAETLDQLTKCPVTHLRRRQVDFNSLNWRERWSFLSALCFPPPAYIQLQRPEFTDAAKPYLFLHYALRPFNFLFNLNKQKAATLRSLLP